ncbi:MAG: ABC transporter permease [Xanthobacteraceae bacterium]
MARDRERPSAQALGVAAFICFAILLGLWLRPDGVDQVVGLTPLVCKFDNSNYLTLASALSASGASLGLIVCLSMLFSSINPPRWSAYAVGVGTMVAFLLAVQALIERGCVNRFIVPFPSDIIAAFPRIVVEEGVMERFLLTAAEAFSASIMVTVVGVAVAVLLHRYRLLRLATETWVAAVAAAPLVLMYPLYLVIFGRSALTIVMMGFTAGLAPIILKTLEGLSATKRVLINVGRSLNLTPAQQFWKILFPSAMPTIFVGLRLGLIFSLINIVGVEFLINFGGLGQLINELAERYDLPGTYAAICFVILVSICVFVLMERLERWLRPAT